MPTFPHNPNDRPIVFTSFRNPNPPPDPRPPIRWDNIRPMPHGTGPVMTERLLLVTVEMHPPGRKRTFEGEPFSRMFTGIKD